MSDGPALVLGDDLGVYLAVARSLGRIGVEVDVVPSEDGHPGLASRFIHATHHLPDYANGADAWTAALRELIDRAGIRLVIPCSDDNLTRLVHHREAIGPHLLALPNAEALSHFTDKENTRVLAASLGIPTAAGTALRPGDEPASLADRLGLPLVLKPRASYRPGDRQAKCYALIVRSATGLAAELPAAVARGWIAESYFEGVGVGLSILARQGRILLAAQHRRLKTLSETGGSSVRIAESPDPTLLAAVEALAAATRLSGVAMFEFRVDRPTGRYVLLEVNPRFWGSLPLAVAAGADFPAALWREHCAAAGATLPPAPAFRAGLVKRNMTGEFDALVVALEEGRGPADRVAAIAALAGFVPRLALAASFDSWAADDPRPFRKERGELFRRLAKGFARWPRLKPASPRGEPMFATPPERATPPAT